MDNRSPIIRNYFSSFHWEFFWVTCALIVASIFNYVLSFDGANVLVMILNGHKSIISNHRFASAIFQIPTLISLNFFDHLSPLRAIFSFSYSIPVLISLVISYCVLPSERKNYWNFVSFGLISGTVVSQGNWVSEVLIVTQFSWPILILLFREKLSKALWIILLILLFFYFNLHPISAMITLSILFFMILSDRTKSFERPEFLIKVSILFILVVLKIVTFYILADRPETEMSFVRYIFPNPKKPILIGSLYLPILICLVAQYTKRNIFYILLTIVICLSIIGVSLEDVRTPFNSRGDIVLPSILLMGIFCFFYHQNIKISRRFIYLSKIAALLFFIVISAQSFLWSNYEKRIVEFFDESSKPCMEVDAFRKEYRPNRFSNHWSLGALSLVLNESRTLRKAILPTAIDCQSFSEGSPFIYVREKDYVSQINRSWFR